MMPYLLRKGMTNKLIMFKLAFLFNTSGANPNEAAR